MNIQKQQFNFLDQQKIQDGAVLVQKFSMQGTDGNPYWYVMLIAPVRYEEFINALNAHKPGDTIDLNQYGLLIAYGPGEEADEDSLAKIKEEFDIDVK